jgi:hypothetical protein
MIMPCFRLSYCFVQSAQVEGNQVYIVEVQIVPGLS